MKRIIQGGLTLIITIAMIIDGYLLFFRNRHVTAQSMVQTATSTASSSQKVASSPSTSAHQNYQNGSYTGKATATQWGDVQVQAVIKNGKITAVNVLEYPNENGHDKEINAQALPTYKAEALKKQSAKIQLVSGASETYKGFTGSLQNALDQAEG
ncbi:FMN-binding protein [Levilactobacillus enshiensis]|uniref:FMN-binding protein n=1 Tax=Levilactobacillus enshiensis TaxID=2590213 RepID=UPI001179C860|nr:FMN-binding protein [Levilactobacillus enshiensis]